MSGKELSTIIILLSCKDQKGLVFKLTNFIYKIGGNIIDLDEHVAITDSMFFVRIAFNMANDKFDLDILKNDFSHLGDEFKANWEIYPLEKRQKAAIFVSKYDHCLQDVLWRTKLNELNIDIKLIVSNHPDLQSLADQYNVPYHHFNINKENKLEVESKQIDLLTNNRIDFIVLARYMQILSPTFVKQFQNRIINIHHSFLPAFIGGNPYKQAYQRGVKIIGATCHYVTDELDEGPIIEQDIIRISHDDSLSDLVRKGRDLERLVLARGILLHSQYKILIHGKKTIVF
jgi:formyltetrahydrofolate deformylase